MERNVATSFCRNFVLVNQRVKSELPDSKICEISTTTFLKNV